MPFNLVAAVALIADALLLGVIIIKPLGRRFDHSDAGGGSARVILPAPRKASLPQSFTFIAVAMAVGAAMIGVRNPDLTAWYRGVVAALATQVTDQPGFANSLSAAIIPVVPIAIVAYCTALAVVIPATPGRRLMILLHGPLFVATSIATDAVLAVFSIVTRLPLGPYPLMSILLHFSIGSLVFLRLASTSFRLPERTRLPRRARHDTGDNVLLGLSLAASFATAGTVAVFAIGAVGDSVPLQTLIVFSLPTYALFGTYAVLALMRLIGPRQPDPGDSRPPLEVIIPAFNEEANIGPLLLSIDEAAAAYQGPVRIILCDDGSTDDTRVIARQAIVGFKAATGEIIDGVHGGKSSALNQALARCTADLVVRVDADCRIGRDALTFTVPWFRARPDIGMVGAFTLPKKPYTTWIDRMRLLELALAVGFSRPSADTVDGVHCIWGTYTAFRRTAALEAGGFVEGMFGEDYEFTCALARLGYRAVVDRRVRVFEDVPTTWQQLRIQRVRWNRGGTQTFGRYTPFRLEPTGPRFWFFGLLMSNRRLGGPMRVAALVYVLDRTLLHPTSQNNLAQWVLLFVMSLVPALGWRSVAAIACGEWRAVFWLPLWFFFTVSKRLFQLEAVLTFPLRPVVELRTRLPERRRGAQAGTPAVVRQDAPAGLT